MLKILKQKNNEIWKIFSLAFRLRRRAFAASPLSQGLNPDGLTIPNATPPGTDAHASETSVR